MIIGITGSSGAGKSIICNILQNEYKVKIINADEIAKELSKSESNYIKDIINKFGKEIVDENGELKRKELAKIIYSNTDKREDLNNCTFKYIKKEIEKQINATEKDLAIIIDAPLLFESKLNEICNKVIGIISKKDLQIERIIKRDNISFDEAKSRLNAQKDNKFYIENCDRIIENNNDILHIENEINNIAKLYGLIRKK